MCRILAITSFDITKHSAFIDSFFSLAHCGMVPPNNEAGHLDGWGIGYYINGVAQVIKSGGSLLDEKERFYAAINKIATSPVLIVHLRKSAWTGTTAERHAHPFEFKNCLFAHNGVVHDYQSMLDEIAPENRPAYDSVDTEVWFHHILNTPDQPLSEALAASAAHIRKHYLFSALNCVLTNGTSLVALRDCTKWPDYYTLFHTTQGTSAIVCSEQITRTDQWQALPLATTITF